MNQEVKIFFSEILKVVVLVVLVVLVLNTVYYELIVKKKIIYRTEEIYNEYINSLENKTIDYAFFGDSMPLEDINPKFVPDSFNLGSSNQNYIIAYYKINKLINYDHIRINHIILQIDLKSFAHDKYDGNLIFDEENLWFWSKYVPYSEIKKFLGRSYLAIFIESNFPFLGSGTHLGILDNPQALTKIYLGYNEFDGYEYFYTGNKTKNSELLYKIYFNEIKVRINPLAEEYLGKIIRLAKENNITVVFIKYPVTKEFYNLLSNENVTNQKEFYDNLFMIVNKSATNYYILDYQKLYLNKTEYFGDPTHLNINGSTEFSKMISRQLAKLP